MKGYKKGRRKVSLRVRRASFSCSCCLTAIKREWKSCFLQSKSKHQQGKDLAGAAGNQHLSEAAKVSRRCKHSADVSVTKNWVKSCLCALSFPGVWLQKRTGFLFPTFSTDATLLVHHLPLYLCFSVMKQTPVLFLLRGCFPLTRESFWAERIRGVFQNKGAFFFLPVKWCRTGSAAGRKHFKCSCCVSFLSLTPQAEWLAAQRDGRTIAGEDEDEDEDGVSLFLETSLEL